MMMTTRLFICLCVLLDAAGAVALPPRVCAEERLAEHPDEMNPSGRGRPADEPPSDSPPSTSQTSASVPDQSAATVPPSPAPALPGAAHPTAPVSHAAEPVIPEAVTHELDALERRRSAAMAAGHQQWVGVLEQRIKQIKQEHGLVPEPIAGSSPSSVPASSPSAPRATPPQTRDVRTMRYDVRGDLRGVLPDIRDAVKHGHVEDVRDHARRRPDPTPSQ